MNAFYSEYPAAQYIEIVSDLTIATSFFAIPVILAIFLKKRRNFSHRWILWSFSAFIAACGATHLLSVIILYDPIFWVEVASKSLTALLSISAALFLGRATPTILKLPTTKELEEANQALAKEVEDKNAIEQRFEMIIESANDAIAIFDQDLIFLYWNKIAEKNYGGTKEERIGKRIDAFRPESTKERVKLYEDDIALFLATGESRLVNKRQEVKSWDANDREIIIDVYIASIPYPNGKFVFASFSRDITEQRRLQDLAVKRAQELEAFSYSVSHDLRAPLRTINGFAYLLANQVEGLPPQAKEYLANIQARAEYMAHLIDDLLAISRLGRQAMKIQKFETLDLAKTIATEVIANEDANRIEKRKIELIVHPLPAVTGDKTLITQVFTNLISNAVKYSRKTELAKIEIGFQDNAFFVKDNGVGFKMEYAPKLFGVFQRLHRQEEYEGTGVGLAIVKKILEKHNGSIWVESKVNHGATFYFTIGVV